MVRPLWEHKSSRTQKQYEQEAFSAVRKAALKAGIGNTWVRIAIVVFWAACGWFASRFVLTWWLY